jgi:hypothetical protein
VGFGADNGKNNATGKNTDMSGLPTNKDFVRLQQELRKAQVLINELNAVVFVAANSTQQSFVSNADFYVEWDDEKIKDDNYVHSESTNPERVSVLFSGLYRIKADIPLKGVQTAGNHSDISVRAKLVINTTDDHINYINFHIDNTEYLDTSVTLETYVSLNIGDMVRIELSIKHDNLSGDDYGDITVNEVSTREGRFIIEKVR